MNRLRSQVAGVTFLAALAALFPASVHAAGRVQCSAVQSAILKRAVRYCAMLPPSYDADKARRFPVLYYLHGLFENEQTMINAGGWSAVEDLQRRKEIGEFLVVIPDGGRSFYINSRDGRERYEDFFIREFLPAIERAFRTQAGRAARGIGGTSMGGYGALRLAFKHPELFVSVTAHSAALMDNPSKEFTSAVAPLLGRVTGAFGGPPDAPYWLQQNPFTLARQSKGLSRLKIYFDCGTEDDYGFEEGAKKLHELLESRHVAHEFHLYPGGHGWSFVAAHIQDSLAFHSRAFGLTK